MFHSDGRSVEALLKHMPKRRIWDVEGRVRGTNLGNNKFHFDFDKEEDLLKVLDKRPCHFYKWSFSLERWTPTIKEDFPNFLPFWALVSGVPIHYKKPETYESVGKALRVFDKADVERSWVRVFVNGDLPLKLECKVGFENGDIVKVTIQYEDLYRHCFSCKRISHEEGTCPELNDRQRERNRLARIEQKEKEDRAMKEALSLPQRQSSVTYTDKYNRDNMGRESRSAYQVFPGARRDDSRDDGRYQDLRKHIWERRDAHTKNRYHPYQHSSGAISKEKTRDTASSSEWRPKRSQEQRSENRLAPQWDKGNTSSRSRMTTDSQRTISENPRRKGYMASNRGRYSRSPPPDGMECKPVDKARESEAPRGLLKKDNKLVISNINSGGEAMEGSESRRSNSDARDVEKDGQQPHNMEAVSREKGQERSTIRTPRENIPIISKIQELMHRGNQDEVLETEKEREKRELNKSVDEYAALAMNAGMVDDDDLLDAFAEPEEQNREAEMEDGRIEAISQLSPERNENKSNGSGAMESKITKQGVEEGEVMENNKKEQRSARTSQQTTIQGRRRGARSLDLKGASASKKLASRGRLSPKTKVLKSARETTYGSSKVPRHVVYPSANTSRKTVSMLGSVVSHKPPSTQI
ncbi:hypothetical protein Bca101_083186 [Brassica carinata]